MNLIKKKKLLFFISSYSNYLNDFVGTLEKKFEVKVFLTQNNTTFTSYKLSEKKNYSLIRSKNFKKKIEQFSPDIIIVGGFKHFLIEKILKYKEKKNIKLYLWLERINKNFILKNKIYSILYKRVFNSCNGVMAIGKEAFNYYKRLNKNTFLIPYNIDFDIFKKNKCKNSEINILYVGQLIERKGISFILKALKNIDKEISKKLKITFVGNGLYEKKILSFRDKNKIFDVKIHKFLSRKKLINIYQNNNIFLFPSLYDGWGVAVMEAMASGMAIIISKNCGMAEFIKNKRNGIIIDTNSEEISYAIKYYYNNPKLITDHGIKNLKLSKNSLLNSSKAVKAFFKFIQRS